MSDLIERLRDKKRLRAAHGLTGWVLADESLHTEAADEIERLTAALQHEADCVEAAKAEIERLTAALETERMRLAACGVVALANTEQSAAKEREMLPEYRSASLADVERAVDREMQLRAERDELRERLVRAEASVEEMCADSWQLRKTISRVEAERDELRRQLDPMGEYTSADELIAALRAEKAEDEAMKLDAQRYRWLRPRFFAADFAYSDPPICAIVFRWPESAKISANLDREIDAAMGLTRPAEE